MNILRLALAAALGALFVAQAATAQTGTRVLIRGVLTAIDGKTATVATR